MDKKVLLIADDDDMNRLIIRKFLKSDYEILEAADGAETLDILENNHVDALLLDIIMPEPDGLEVLKIMKKNREFDYIAVLVATSTKEKTERDALSLGADDIVSKPYDPIVIKKRMSNILGMKAIKSQKDMLQNNDIKSYIDVLNEEMISEINKSVEQIKKFSQIIKANKSNYKLVDEMSDEIETESDILKTVVEKHTKR